MPDNLINCGERTVQKLHRVTIKDVCTTYGILEGDRVEVYIKKVER